MVSWGKAARPNAGIFRAGLECESRLAARAQTPTVHRVGDPRPESRRVCIVEEVIETSTADFVLLAGAGLLAGVLGSAGGTASLVSFPALLAVGIPAFQANVTNAVAFVAVWPGSALGSATGARGSG
jgi:hypothetical protein